MIFSKTLIIFIFLESIILLSSFFCLYFAYRILKKWDFNSTSTFQYSLEKSDYFVSLVLFITLLTKVILLPFFINLLDSLSYKLPGAMCAAGVISANEYGNILLVFKIFIIFLSGIWLYLYKQDKVEINFPFIKQRYGIFCLLFALFIFEIFLEYMFFSNIDTSTPVACCSIIFGVNSNSVGLPFGISIEGILILFYFIFFIITFTYFRSYNLLNSLANILFLILSFYALTYFFSTYVYALPTHKCPYCLFQKDYYFVGYIFWGTLLLGIFYSSCAYILSLITKYDFTFMYKISYIFNLIFTILCTSYVAIFYFTNGVFL